MAVKNLKKEPPVTKETDKVNILLKFIENNNLTFYPGGRNSNIVSLCGFACAIKATSEQCIEAIRTCPDWEAIDESEIERIYDYADSNMYKHYWNSVGAKKSYVFDRKDIDIE